MSEELGFLFFVLGLLLLCASVECYEWFKCFLWRRKNKDLLNGNRDWMYKDEDPKKK